MSDFWMRNMLHFVLEMVTFQFHFPQATVILETWAKPRASTTLLQIWDSIISSCNQHRQQKKTIALRWITKRREEAASRENRRNSIPLMQMMKLAILEVEVGSSMTLPKSKIAWIVNVHKMLSLRHSRCTALKKCFRFDLRLQLLWVIRQTGIVRKPMQMWAAGIVPYSTQLFLAIIFRQADKRKKFFAQTLFVNRSSCRAEDVHCSED